MLNIYDIYADVCYPARARSVGLRLAEMLGRLQPRSDRSDANAHSGSAAARDSALAGDQGAAGGQGRIKLRGHEGRAAQPEASALASRKLVGASGAALQGKSSGVCALPSTLSGALPRSPVHTLCLWFLDCHVVIAPALAAHAASPTHVCCICRPSMPHNAHIDELSFLHLPWPHTQLFPPTAAAHAGDPMPYDPCIDNEVSAYLNRPEVQRAIHANVSGTQPGPWQACSTELEYSKEDLLSSVLPLYTKLLQSGAAALAARQHAIVLSGVLW